MAILRNAFRGLLGLLLLTSACFAQSAAILPNAKTQFLDANGQPLAGGKVYTYVPNTSSPKTTWSNAFQTVANTNPVILDSSGSAFIFGLGNYTETVNDANGNLIWSGFTSAIIASGGGGGSGTVTGPATSTVGDLALWGNTTGTVLVDQAVLGVNHGGTGTTTFTVNQPLIGSGGSAVAQGTLSGNTTEFGTVNGAFVSGDCLQGDSSGNIVDSGLPCNVGGLIVGTTVVTGASNGQYLYNNAGVLGAATLGTMATQSAGAVAITGGTIAGVAITGGTIGSAAISGGTITGLPAPSVGSDAANKAYVDSVATGLVVHPQALLATTAALPANTYNNGSGGVGATLTGNSNGALTVDSVLTTTSARVVVQNEAAAADNGIYVVTTVGNGSTPYVLTRATDANTAGTGDPTKIGEGTYVFVTSGTLNANKAFIVNSTVATIGSSAINWVLFSSSVATTVTASDSSLIISPTSGNILAHLNTANANIWTAPIAISIANSGLLLNDPSGSGQTLIEWQSSGTNKFRLLSTATHFSMFDEVAALTDFTLTYGGNMALMPSGGSVGIGPSPNAAFLLDVAGAVRANGAANNAGVFMSSTSGAGIVQAVNSANSAVVPLIMQVFGGAVVVGAPTGGALSSGTLNAQGLYVNGVPVTGGGGSPAGSNTQVQYNNSGSFGGAAGVTTNGSSLTVLGNLPIGGGDPWVDVKSGANSCAPATGNGSTDDTTAINCQLTFVGGTSNQGVVYVPPGNYKLTGTLTIPAGVTVQCANENASDLNGSFGNFNVIHFTGNYSNLRDCSVEGNLTTGASAATILTDAGTVGGTLFNLNVQGGIYALDMNGTDWRVYNVYAGAYGTTSGGATVISTGANFYTDCKFDITVNPITYGFLQSTSTGQENHILDTDFSGTGGASYTEALHIDDGGSNTAITIIHGGIFSAPINLVHQRWTALNGAELGGNVSVSAGTVAIAGSFGSGITVTHANSTCAAIAGITC